MRQVWGACYLVAVVLVVVVLKEFWHSVNVGVFGSRFFTYVIYSEMVALFCILRGHGLFPRGVARPQVRPAQSIILCVALRSATELSRVEPSACLSFDCARMTNRSPDVFAVVYWNTKWLEIG